MSKIKLLSFSIILLLSGCVSLAPSYEQPALPVPERFSLSKNALTEAPADLQDTGWREFFVDAALRELIETALASNRDLRLAVIKLEQAKAQMGVTDAARAPALNAAGSNTYKGGLEGASGTTQTYALGATLSFDLDFFGRLKNLSDAARESYLASEASRRDVHILLVSQVAQAYFAQQRAIRQLALARETLHNYERAYSVIESQLRTGRTTVLALEQARGQIDSMRASIAQLSGSLAQANNALSLVLGVWREAPAPSKTPEADLVPVKLPANLSSQILLQRPDIQQAEHLLRAANANIGAARAAFFPSITLTSALSLSSPALSNLFSLGSAMWNFVPQITAPLFDAGKNTANLRLMELKRDEAVVNYEQKIQSAFKEVSDTLVLRESLASQIAARRAYLQSLEVTLARAQALFAHGAVSYIEVLDAQRNVFTTEQTLVDLLYNQQINEINLFTALGGGWSE